MKLLITGANGYIGTRLIPLLLNEGHDLVCMVRDKRRFIQKVDLSEHVHIIEADLISGKGLDQIPRDIEAAYYLVHSMSSPKGDFSDTEKTSAENFSKAMDTTSCKQVIFLTGIVNDIKLSKHLSSRLAVEDVLNKSKIPCTVLRAAIIIGSGSASFEIIRDLTEKLPIMVAPKWVLTRCQPIGIRDVLRYLTGILNKEESYGKAFDIGGPDILTYQQMLLIYAESRNLKRYILNVPFLTPKLSSYWLNLVTSVPFSLASSLVESMKNEVICHDDHIKKIIPGNCLTYRESLKLAFVKIEQNSIVSSWKDALNRGYLETTFMNQVKVPQNGTVSSKVKIIFKRNTNEVLDNIWGIGGNRGWYYLNFLWKLRGFADKVVGGVGMRRGRRSPISLLAGDTLDFWRVLLVDKEKRRLLLYAEMKLPGEAWLEFYIDKSNPSGNTLIQTATFRPRGLWGRLYWYAMWPFHLFIFKGMANELIRYQPKLLKQNP
ncbi:SDR family oxidoreductase [Arcticibacter eurypsychrophilus]|uniref:SDR family oxidoreductase n=1 Tax=Arcticibacter eurypsychrophilus TaxID=1434752 RepID=UPI00084DBB3C|nr:SDR family oxidoreductase [Arcticibacter eurypsychrophilus]